VIAEGDFTDEQLLLTTVQAAKVLGVGRTTIYELIKQGQLRPIHISRSCRISWAELERFVRRLDGSDVDGDSRHGVRRWRRVTSPDGSRALFPVEAVE
jgi:excisionase family DNA binding protein